MSCLRINYEVSGGDEIANRVIDRMDKELAELKKIDSNNGTKELTLNMLQCTEGSLDGVACVVLRSA